MRNNLTKEEQCQGRVSPPGLWGAFQQHQCYKKAVVVRDGKRYCKVHDPEYRKAKSETKTAQYDRELAIRERRAQLHRLAHALWGDMPVEDIEASMPRLKEALERD